MNETNTNSRIDTTRDNQFEWDHFCKLGEMIGDGLHNEPDGKWISKEYARLSKILIPELKEEAKARRVLKNAHIDAQMTKLIGLKKCVCGGILKQSRSGSKIAYCTQCDQRYKARK